MPAMNNQDKSIQRSPIITQLNVHSIPNVKPPLTVSVTKTDKFEWQHFNSQKSQSTDRGALIQITWSYQKNTTPRPHYYSTPYGRKTNIVVVGS